MISRALIVILLGVSWLVAADRTADKRPNIILAMADDQGWGDMGYMGHKIPHTADKNGRKSSITHVG